VNILFITSNRLGDAVLSTGLLATLAERHPQARFTITCGPFAAGLFRAAPRLDRIVILDKKTWNRHWCDLWLAAAGTRWDLIVDLRDSLVSRLLFARRKARRVKRPGAHKVIENAAALGMEEHPPAPHIWLDDEAHQEAQSLLPPTRPLLALGPAANWACKQWPAGRFAELAHKLIAEDGPLAGADVLVIADRHERAQIATLIAALPPDRCVEIIGRELLTVAACLKQCRLYVGNDSGLMHLAAAMGAPTLGLFGPGYEEIYGPWGAKSAVIRTPESRNELLARLSPSHQPNLMSGLWAETVFEAAEKLLARTA